MKFGALREWFKHEDAVVVGCGPSATDAENEIAYHRFWTFGCNRAVRFCEPDFGVCIEPPRDAEIWRTMRFAPLPMVFSQHSKRHPRVVEISVKDVRAWFHWDDGDDKPLRISQSGFFATAVALFLGFETVGLIGLDMTAPVHDSKGELGRINDAFMRLRGIAEAHDQRLLNLSPASRLATIERGPWSEMRRK